MIPPLLALFSWPLAVVALARRFDPARAFVLAVLGGFLLLPVQAEFDLPLLPALTKQSVPVLSVLLFLALFRSREGPAHERPLFPQSPLVILATLGLAVGALITVTQNGDPLFYGPTALPGMRLYDGMSQILSAMIMVLPLLLARKFLARPEDHLLLLKLLCLAGLGYSLLALFEVRMSPQMNRWVYGIVPHSWFEIMRGGGFRPFVFLSHGLVLAIFFAMIVLAAAGLVRLVREKRGFYIGALVWLLLTLMLCKSLGAFLIALAMLPIALLLRVRGQLVVASLLAGVVLLYPMARSSGIIPVYEILDTIEQYDPERAFSLNYRLTNEDSLLAKARERAVFGWGGWARQHVYDPKTGADLSITDGYWIIIMGKGGWVRYIFEFGLLCVPVFLLWLHRRRYEIGMESSILALIMAANLVDLLPNAGITPVTWMLAGALWGRLELGRVTASVSGEVVRAPAQAGYRRGAQPEPELPTEAPVGDTPAPSTPYTRQQIRHQRKRV